MSSSGFFLKEQNGEWYLASRICIEKIENSTCNQEIRYVKLLYFNLPKPGKPDWKFLQISQFLSNFLE